MLFFEMHRGSDLPRLLTAVVGAISAHILLFAFGLLTISQTSTPSNVNRMLVLTLENTLLEGLQEPDSTASDTINDTPIGAPESLPALFEPSEVSQMNFGSALLPAAQSELQADEPPTADITEKGEVIQKQIVLESAQSTTVAAAELSDAASVTALDKDAVATVPQEQAIEQPFLTAAAGQLTIPGYQATPQTTAKLAASITQRQKRMLDRKIKKLAEKIDLSEHSPETISWRQKGQTYTAKFSRLLASGDMDMDKMVVEVTTEQDGQQLTTTMQMKQLSFSNFAQFVHRWDPSVVVHDDQMDGRFHSNSRINLDYDQNTQPVFHGKVTTASYGVDFDRVARKATRKQIFRGGLETGVKKIHMPKPKRLFSGARTLDRQNTKLFTQDTRIIFKADGRYIWQKLDADAVIEQQLIGDKPLYLLAAPNTTLHVSGTVKGKVLVYSPQRIVIEDDLVYSRSGLSGGDDLLGLVSDQDIVIAKQEVTGAGDLTINASIYAKHRFAIKEYSSGHTGTLTIVGSVSAGSLSATEPRYASRIVFDKRFETRRPPGFPVTGSYELTNQDYHWMVTPPRNQEGQN